MHVTGCVSLPCFFNEDEDHTSVLCFFLWQLVSRWIWTWGKQTYIIVNTVIGFIMKKCVEMHKHFNMAALGCKWTHTLKWAVLDCICCCLSFSDDSPQNTSYKKRKERKNYCCYCKSLNKQLFMQCNGLMMCSTIRCHVVQETLQAITRHFQKYVAFLLPESEMRNQYQPHKRVLKSCAFMQVNFLKNNGVPIHPAFLFSVSG